MDLEYLKNTHIVSVFEDNGGRYHFQTDTMYFYIDKTPILYPMNNNGYNYISNNPRFIESLTDIKSVLNKYGNKIFDFYVSNEKGCRVHIGEQYMPICLEVYINNFKENDGLSKTWKEPKGLGYFFNKFFYKRYKDRENNSKFIQNRINSYLWTIKE